jgi:hypothetical protein
MESLGHDDSVKPIKPGTAVHGDFASRTAQMNPDLKSQGTKSQSSGTLDETQLSFLKLVDTNT